MLNFKLFAGHPNRYRILGIINTVMVLAVLLPVWQLGYLSSILRPDALLIIFIAYMVWKYAKAYFYQRKIAEIVDKEKHTQIAVSQAFSSDMRDYNAVDEQVAYLLSGDMLKNIYDNTGFQSFIEELERSIVAVPTVPLRNMEDYYSAYYNAFIAEALPAMREARDQTTYGFIGTVLGLVVGIGSIAMDSFKTADGAAEASALVMGGMGIALITTLFGLVLGLYLRRQNDSLRTAFDRVATKMWREMMVVGRVLQDEERFQHVVQINKEKWLPVEAETSPDTTQT